jgi:hypothetical protein
MGGFKDRNRFTDSKKNHWFRGLLRHFRGDAARFEFTQRSPGHIGHVGDGSRSTQDIGFGDRTIESCGLEAH